jgi:hypothetical protein
LDFVAPGLEFVAPAFDFVAPGLEIVAANLLLLRSPAGRRQAVRESADGLA